MVADGLIRSACGAGGGIASPEGEGAEYCQYGKPERWNKVLWASLRESLGRVDTYKDRQKLYVKGGIFSITSRILVVDLLTSMILPLA